LLNNVYYNANIGHTPVDNSAQMDPSFIREAFNLIRTQKSAYVSDMGAGVTDVRLFTVAIDLAINGIYVTGR
jgi:GTP:adenosylcobinamide-phosphate guanylyltransferase